MTIIAPLTCKFRVFITKIQIPRFLSTLSNIQELAMPEKKPFQRLPTNVKPVNYAIRIQPNLKECTFEGSEDIQLTVKESTDKIVLNSVNLDISKVAFSHSGGKVSGDVIENKDDETIQLSFPSAVQPGEGTLSLSFKGKLDDSMKGLYRTKYQEAGETRYAAVTQFESTDARRAFPCWDEPALKATFDITLVVPNDRVALSNMPIKDARALESGDGMKVLTFQRSPIMSTYLVAIVVGEYDYIEGKDTNGVIHRVYTPRGKKEQGRFALEVSLKTLPFYKEFFHIPYPLPKLDLIAIPDFMAGAMENWGLVTYRENALLIDPDHSSQRTKLRVALVVGHELAHMWFGNLVTMEWWTHLWLNEGFATWIEYHSIDYCFPEFDAWTQFACSEFSSALSEDALDSSHPIEVPVGHPSEIDEIFDTVSYAKGASVIRMLHNFIGNECFRKGLASYLQKHKYSNTFTEDLWNSLAESSNKPIAKIMSTWTAQMGYPLIAVTQKQEGNKRILHVSQKKFCAGGQTDSKAQWKVPLSFSTKSSGGKAMKTVLLEQPSLEITLEGVNTDEWVKLNPGCVDFYRVQYSTSMLDQLIKAVSSGEFEARDRLNLQNDVFALSMAGSVPANEVLKLVSAYENEDNYTVWQDITSNLAGISNILQYTDFYDKYSNYITRLYGKIHEKLGWDEKPNESPLLSMLRGTVLSRMGIHGNATVIAEAQRRFAEHCSGNTTLPSNIRAAVYATVMTHGDEAVFNQLLELCKKSELQEESTRLFQALGAGKTDALIQKALDFSLSGQLRNNEILYVVAGATRRANGRELLWNVVKNNWDTFNQKFAGSMLMSRFIKCAANNFATEEKAIEVENFFKDHEATSAERAIQQSLENIRLNSRWLKRDEAALRKFLS